MTDINDHPVRAHCPTCRFAGSDGYLGEITTCDIEYIDDTADRDLLDQIDLWVRKGEVGACPGWQPADWTNPE